MSTTMRGGVRTPQHKVKGSKEVRPLPSVPLAGSHTYYRIIHTLSKEVYSGVVRVIPFVETLSHTNQEVTESII